MGTFEVVELGLLVPCSEDDDNGTASPVVALHEQLVVCEICGDLCLRHPPIRYEGTPPASVLEVHV